MVGNLGNPRARPMLHPRGSGTGNRRLAANLLQRAQERFQVGAYRDAGDAARQALELDEKSADAFQLLGAIAVAEEKFAEAEALLRNAVSLNRNSAHLRYHLANAQRAQGNNESAAAAYRQALKLNPSLAPSFFGLAMALRGLGERDEAAATLFRYLQRQPTDADAHYELGMLFRESGRLEQALKHLRLAVRARPDHKGAALSLATTLLLAENFREGWPIWLQMFTRTPVLLPDPTTSNLPFEGKQVVIYANEGVGDEIMFASCLPAISASAVKVTLYCDHRLAPLFQRSFHALRTLGMDKEHEQRTIGLVAPDEIHIFASFLPAYFHQATAGRPERRSYLLADPRQVSVWRQRFSALGPGLKVGLSWLGGADPYDRSRRSIPLASWQDILGVDGVHFVNLQYGAVAAETEAVQKRLQVPIHTWGDANPLLNLDFSAAQIAALDLVISVDNTTVHLAGALGTPVWTLLPFVPDWRWTMAGTRTPWYPSVRLFRQETEGHWEHVLHKVQESLSDYVDSSGCQT